MKRNHRNRVHFPASVSILVMCILYLLFSVGIIKATHFCMGREASVAYFTAETKKCPCSLFTEGKDNCCDDVHDLLKLDDSQKTLQSFQLHFPALTFLGDRCKNTLPAAIIASPQFTASSPDWQPPPKVLYRIHCSFVFYDSESIT